MRDILNCIEKLVHAQNMRSIYVLAHLCVVAVIAIARVLVTAGADEAATNILTKV